MCERTIHKFTRNNVGLCMNSYRSDKCVAGKIILLVHGLTYSSHLFDLQYQDYSLCAALAENGYYVWRLDLAGYGCSGEIEDGFLPDSGYASEDISAAVDKIAAETGVEKIDLLGWSWGTVTTSRYVAMHPDRINRYIMFAPIITGWGKKKVEDAFHKNTWEHAAEDFQKTDGGNIDLTIIDPIVLELFCSSCWHYDGDHSPNGGRRDLYVEKTEQLIHLENIKNETLVICGDNDPLLNMDMINSSLELLPEGSELEIINGGAHVVFLEKPYYKQFQKRIIEFLG